MNPAWPRLPVAIVAPLYAPATGGVERHVERLALGLQARGIPLDVLTTSPGLRHPTSELRDGIRVLRFPTIRDDRTYFPAPQLARWLDRHAARYALLHAHNLHTLVPLAATWAGRSGTPPMVLTAHWHGTGHTPLRRALHVPYRPVAVEVARHAAGVIANSRAEAAQLRQDLGAMLPITVIPPGIDLPGDAVPGIDPPGDAVPRGSDPDGVTGQVTLLSVGRLERYKGVEQMVGALAGLPASVRLVVVGQGPAEESIAAAADAAGVRDRLVLRGRVTDAELRGWYGSAAAFVSLSAHEAFGLTVLEAAAAGMPIIASDIPAYRESTDYVPAGRIELVDMDGGPQAIAAAVRGALAQGRVRDTAGWPIPSWGSLVDGTLEVYRSVLGD